MGLLKFYLAIYAVIFFHEIGHFITAIFLGIKIDVFKIGLFKIFGFNIRETKIEFGLIPIFGVVIPDIDNLFDIKRSTRILFYLSGPIASMILSYYMILFSGKKLIESLVISISWTLSVPIQIIISVFNLDLIETTTSTVTTTDLANMLRSGPAELLYFVGIFSALIIGVNMIPIPPLDGGIILFEILEGLFGKRKVKSDQLTGLFGREISIVFMIRIIISLIVVIYAAYGFAQDFWNIGKVLFETIRSFF